MSYPMLCSCRATWPAHSRQSGDRSTYRSCRCWYVSRGCFAGVFWRRIPLTTTRRPIHVSFFLRWSGSCMLKGAVVCCYFSGPPRCSWPSCSSFTSAPRAYFYAVSFRRYRRSNLSDIRSWLFPSTPRFPSALAPCLLLLGLSSVLLCVLPPPFFFPPRCAAVHP